MHAWQVEVVGKDPEGAAALRSMSEALAAVLEVASYVRQATQHASALRTFSSDLMQRVEVGLPTRHAEADEMYGGSGQVRDELRFACVGLTACSACLMHACSSFYHSCMHANPTTAPPRWIIPGGRGGGAWAAGLQRGRRGRARSRSMQCRCRGAGCLCRGSG